VASPRRFRSLPEVPALAETLLGLESVAWFGIVGPPKTSGQIAEKVAAGVAEALRNPEVLRRLSDLSADPLGGREGRIADARIRFRDAGLFASA
jgi:tripartite-type tricarboxylate transporter receptor subunit TctC